MKVYFFALLMILVFPIASFAYADKDPKTLEIILIYSTPNESCDIQETSEMRIFEKSIKQYLTKFAYDKKIIQSTICIHVDEIKFSEFPLLLKSLNMQRPDLLIIVGDTEINEELVIFDHALGVYGCISFDSNGNCTTNIILGCTDCEGGLYPNTINTHLWTISHELSHYLLYNKYPDPISDYFESGVHDLQYFYDHCVKYNYFEPCNGMDYKQNLDGGSISVMNLDYIQKNPTPLVNFDPYVFAYSDNEQNFAEESSEETMSSEPEIKQQEPVTTFRTELNEENSLIEFVLGIIDSIFSIIFDVIDKPVEAISNEIESQIESPGFSLSESDTEETQSSIILDIPSNERQITIYIQEIPDVPYKKLAESSAYLALENWQQQNSDVHFSLTQFSDSNIVIEWRKVAAKDHLGVASLGLLDGNVIEVGLGAFDCNDQYVQHDENMVANTIMHEIGHAFGIKHHTDENHLMYGNDEFVTENFDTLGYTIPERLEEGFVSQLGLQSYYNELDKELKFRDMKIDGLESKLETYEAQLKSETDPVAAERLYNNYLQLFDETKSYLQKRNEISTEMTDIANTLNCYPNVDPTLVG